MSVPPPRPGAPVPSWSRLLRAARRPMPGARWTRRAAVALALAATAAGCSGGDDNDNGAVDGIYRLTRVNNSALPYQGVTAGAVQLEGGDYRIELEADGEVVGDQGTYRRSGSTVNFTSTDGGGDYQGSLSSRNSVLTVNLAQSAVLRFERDE